MATGTKIFSGSYLDGPGIDLLAWAGIILTDEQEDLVWAEHNLTSLLELVAGPLKASRKMFCKSCSLFCVGVHESNAVL
jgi:hypothetical protein